MGYPWLRRKLHSADPHCFWCGALTRLEAVTFGVQADDCATIDHVYSWNNPLRREPGGDIVVLACYGCNQWRNQQENLGLPAPIPDDVRAEVERRYRQRSQGVPLRATLAEMVKGRVSA